MEMFEVIKKDLKSKARLGRIHTRHGVIETPAYVMVGTHARVRELDSEDLVKTKTQIVIVNTYHLWSRLEALAQSRASAQGGLPLTGQAVSGLDDFPGLHKYMDWDGPLMTDSGGFQVFSMGANREHRSGKVLKDDFKNAFRGSEENLVRITEDGVYFKTDLDASEQYLDAEKSMWIQERLGADIIFAFDEATSPHHDFEYTRQSMERTHRWASRSLKAYNPKQFLYGIVQGGPYRELREESAKVIGSMPFGGFGIGGSYAASYGDTQKGTYAALDWVIPHLPENKPRHFLGIGKIEDIFEGVARGVDTFDCVIPTREARHGGLWTHQGRIDLKSAKFKDDKSILEKDCGCHACRKLGLKKCELRELFKVKNSEAGRLATFHNVYFFNKLMSEVRDAIALDRFEELRRLFPAVR